jgi:hypothetical protein
VTVPVVKQLLDRIQAPVFVEESYFLLDKKITFNSEEHNRLYKDENYNFTLQTLLIAHPRI